MRRTLSELGLTEKDFKYEFVGFGDPTYVPYTFTPTRTLIAKVNDVVCKVKTNINIEMAQDIEAMTGLNATKEVDKLLKEEAINWYINNNQFIRKMKLTKIKEKYGI
jgi:hypothetical protein